MSVGTAKDKARVQVPLLDLKAQYRQIEPEILNALQEVCSSQYFILGERVKELEEKVADYCQCSHGIGVSSGTDALLVALMALGIGPGDEVLTTPFTFFATGGVIARLGARPIFCDVASADFNLTAASVAEAIERRCEVRDGSLVNRTSGGAVRALMPVHLFGQMAEMDSLMELAKEHGLYVIEDAAQAIGAEDERGRRAGSVGHIGCFSFFPSKNLGALGDAGMCTTNDPELAEKIRILRVHGGKPKYHHAIVGGNFRLDALQAAALLVKLPYLDGWTSKRQANADFYTAAIEQLGLGDRVVTPPITRGYRHIFNQYVIRAQRRDDLRDHLRQAEIGTEIYYPVPLHVQKCFAECGYRPSDCPQSMRAAQEVLALPIYPELTRTQLEHVVESIRRFYC